MSPKIVSVNETEPTKTCEGESKNEQEITRDKRIGRRDCKDTLDIALLSRRERNLRERESVEGSTRTELGTQRTPRRKGDIELALLLDPEGTRSRSRPSTPHRVLHARRSRNQWI